MDGEDGLINDDPGACRVPSVESSTSDASSTPSSTWSLSTSSAVVYKHAKPITPVHQRIHSHLTNPPLPWTWPIVTTHQYHRPCAVLVAAAVVVIVAELVLYRAGISASLQSLWNPVSPMSHHQHMLEPCEECGLGQNVGACPLLTSRLLADWRRLSLADCLPQCGEESSNVHLDTGLDMTSNRMRNAAFRRRRLLHASVLRKRHRVRI